MGVYDNYELHPSSANRWTKCLGSIKLCADNEQKPTQAMLEGSSCHLLSESRLKKVMSAVMLTDSIGKKIGEVFPKLDKENYDEDINEIVITNEMVDATQKYLIFLKSLGGEILIENIEKKVSLEFENLTISGTADCIIDDLFDTHIVDLKYGRLPVSPADNLQLIIYALAHIQNNPMCDNNKSIHLHIFQPRSYDDNFEKTFTTTIESLKIVWLPQLEQIIDKIYNAKRLSFVVGDHCKWCNGVKSCPKNKIVKDISNGKLDTYNIKEVKKILDSESLILEYLKKAKQYAYIKLMNNETIPGYKLVQPLSNSYWIDEKKVMDFLIDKGIIDYSNMLKLLSPTQLKKRLKCKVYGDQYHNYNLDQYVTRDLKDPIIVPESDKRETYNPSDEEMEFPDDLDMSKA